ncbi:MAG: acyl-CoA dehydrogenase family protein [Xanthomonadales bacterium]|nr:acyl-CoA dehydrogenase family protein [Xanthomonadales bacterium]
MGFVQSAPVLDNPFQGDRVLRSALRRLLPPARLEALETEAMALGEILRELYPRQLAEATLEPRLQHWDGWGNRIDRIELSPLWRELPELAARFGLVAHGYDSALEAQARIHQFALVYLFNPGSEFYGCPLAMTDGATRALLDSANRPLIDRAVPHFLAREAADFWTCGQWMTETTGGSDVSQSETIASRDDSGQWRIYGRKWFTSATTSEATLLLARPESSDLDGADGLALFYLEPRDEQGRLNQIEIDRLKDKLGTRKLPTAELRLFGAAATPVNGLGHGIRAIAPVLNITRLWNAFTALGLYRRGLQLLGDYARRRAVFGKPLAEQPLHRETVADLQAEFEAGFHLTMYVAELLGKQEHGQLDDPHRALWRLLTPLAKLWTAKAAVAGLSEIVEGFGGAGYIERTGIPVLLRDAQVLSIWEGTTNVLALDVLRVLRGTDGAFSAYQNALRGLAAQIGSSELREVQAAVLSASKTLSEGMAMLLRDRRNAEALARSLALGLARSMALALLARHADWSLRAEQDPRAAAAARRFARRPLVTLAEGADPDADLLAD